MYTAENIGYHIITEGYFANITFKASVTIIGKGGHISLGRKTYEFNGYVFNYMYIVYCQNANPKTGLLTGCGKKKKIVRVLGGKLCGKKRRLCGNCVGLHNSVNKQIFDHRAPNKTRHGRISG